MPAKPEINIDLGHKPHGPAKPKLTPEERAQRDGMAMASGVIKWTLLPAGILLGVTALLYVGMFSLSATKTWGDIPRLVLPSIALVGLISGIPTAVLFIESKHPKEAEFVLQYVWGGAVALAISIALFYAGPSGKAAPGAIMPKDVLPEMHYAATAQLQQVQTMARLVLSIMCIAGCGWCLRWLCIATAGTHLLFQPAAVKPVQEFDTVSLMPATGSGDIMERWWNYAVRQKPGAQVTFRKLYADYERKCDGICNPMQIGKFSKVLKNLVDTPNSGITKRASNGEVLYEGIELVDQEPDVNVIEMVPLQQIAISR